MNKSSIRELCPDMHSGGTPSTKIPEYWDGNIPWLSSSESGKDFIKLVREGKWIKEMVPITTYEYLKKMNGKVFWYLE